jgi:hypothetical protein
MISLERDLRKRTEQAMGSYPSEAPIRKHFEASQTWKVAISTIRTADERAFILPLRRKVIAVK